MSSGGIFSKFSNYFKSKKNGNLAYKQLINNSKIFDLLYDITYSDDKIIEGHLIDYCNMCANLDIDNAKKIDCVVPIGETVIYIASCKQKLNNAKLFIVFTNYRIFIIGGNKFGLYNYESIGVFQLINKSLITQIVNFNGVVLSIDVNQTELNIIYSIVKNVQYRNSVIAEKTKYLCGVVPIYQNLNKINSGISIDKDKNIVFHNKKANNYICKYSDILNYELLENNVAVLSRKTDKENHSMKFVKKECNVMTFRITLVSNQVFLIDILEPNIFGASYSHTDTNYIENYNFAKEIIDKLDSLNYGL